MGSFYSTVYMKSTYEANLAASPLFRYPTTPVLSSATSIAIVEELYDITPDKIRFMEHGTGTRCATVFFSLSKKRLLIANSGTSVLFTPLTPVLLISCGM